MKTADCKDIEIGYGKKYWVVEREGGYDGELESVTIEQHSFKSFFKYGRNKEQAYSENSKTHWNSNQIFESENEANKEYNKILLSIRKNIKSEIEYLQKILDEPPALLEIET